MILQCQMRLRVAWFQQQGFPTYFLWLNHHLSRRLTTISSPFTFFTLSTSKKKNLLKLFFFNGPDPVFPVKHGKKTQNWDPLEPPRTPSHLVATSWSCAMKRSPRRRRDRRLRRAAGVPWAQCRPGLQQWDLMGISWDLMGFNGNLMGI